MALSRLGECIHLDSQCFRISLMKFKKLHQNAPEKNLKYYVKSKLPYMRNAKGKCTQKERIIVDVPHTE